jgi:spermidine synthase
LFGFAYSERIMSFSETAAYQDPIVFAKSTPYQRMILTKTRNDLRLFLNGNLQFHSRDEYRYHEVLVHPAMAAFSAHGGPKRVLVLGGGDGLAVREVLKYPTVEHITLVELDPHMTQLFARNPVLRKLNGGALQSPKLKVVNTDAYTWLEANREVFDVIVIDFPDPTNFSLGKLYTTSFYQRADQALAAGGYLVVQTTSPLFARKSYWTVVATLEAVGLTTTPLHVHVPSFGEWGFVIASRRPWQPPQQLPAGLRFLTVEGLPALLQFPPDMARVAAEPNRLSNQALVATFEQEWGKVR